MSRLNRLSWDSDFFGIEIAEYHSDDIVELSCLNNFEFDLIVTKTKSDESIAIEGYSPSFNETKIVYSKSINNIDLKTMDSSVLDFDIHPVNAKELFDLAFESGKYSRFNLDSNLSKDKFENLYKEWVINSLNKTFATKMFYTKLNDVITGFVTLQKKETACHIGLIGVKPEFQGQKIGSKLIDVVKRYCLENGIQNLFVATQKANKSACKFYEKNNFEIESMLNISHFWKVN